MCCILLFSSFYFFLLKTECKKLQTYIGIRPFVVREKIATGSELNYLAQVLYIALRKSYIEPCASLIYYLAQGNLFELPKSDRRFLPKFMYLCLVIKEKIILGIDPGTTVMGYGLLKITNNQPSLLAMGVLELNKYDDHYLRLRRIFERVVGLIDEFLPDELAIEAPFYGKNVQSMLKLGRAQGVAMAAALSRDIPIFEYAPLKIKMSITGNGRAAKEQVAGMLQRYLKIPQDQMLPQLDATDGLAAALCHFFQSNRPQSDAKYNSWKDFISKNESKVRR